MSNKAIPNYEMECDNCGQKPTVTMVSTTNADDKTEMEMCGPCTFGESEALDPETWN